jgi:amidophosphoribosyltransferase
MNECETLNTRQRSNLVTTGTCTNCDPGIHVGNDEGLTRVLHGDVPMEECGVFGVTAVSGTSMDASRITFFGLHTLQHRGQEAAGIAALSPVAKLPIVYEHSNPANSFTPAAQSAVVSSSFPTPAPPLRGTFNLHKERGLVTQVFSETTLKDLPGSAAVGHVRHSTSGQKATHRHQHARNAQPFVFETAIGCAAIVHNGHLVKAKSLRKDLIENGAALFTDSDSELIAKLLSRCTGRTWSDRLEQLVQHIEGAFALLLLSDDGTLYGARDMRGLRPLCIGHNGSQTQWSFASESCAFSSTGCVRVADVPPGCVIGVGPHGPDAALERRVKSSHVAECIFETIYFARPDSVFGSTLVHDARQRLGEALALQAPVAADVVAGVPDSSLAAAVGYARASSVPYTEILCKNRYIGRTFIAPTDEQRQSMIRLTYNPLPSNIYGKRIVLVDDSLVRGNTLRHMLPMLRNAGAAEIHVRIISPPVKHPCFMGIDIATQKELIASHKSVEEIRAYIGADSLAFLDHDTMVRVVANGNSKIKMTPVNRFCSACFTGNYPVELDW